MSKFIIIVCLVGGFLFAGCSGVNQVVKSRLDKPAQPDLMSKNPAYRAAMGHFMDGNLNDIKGEFAQAILDYQDALKLYHDPAILDAMAQDFLRLDKPGNAIEEASDAVSLAPDNINYRRTLAQAYLADFKVDSATDQYAAIVRIDTTDLLDMVVLAQLYQRSQPEKAAGLYERILRLHGPDPAIMMQLVQIYNSSGKYARSIDLIKQMLRLDPTNVPLKEMLSDLYLETGSNEKALSILNELMKTHENDFTLKARAATAYLRMKDFTDADSLLDSIFTSDSSKADAKFAIGQFYLDEMQHDSAVVPFAEEIFSKLLETYPNDPRSYLMAGMGASYTKQDSLAQKYLSKAVALDSTNANAWQALAYFYYQSGHFNRMADAMTRAVNIFPQNFQLNLFLGLALNQAKRNAEAVKPLEKAVALRPTSMDALSTLALVYESLNRYTDSDRVYETALQVDPNNALILNNYAYSLSERGLQLPKALKMAQLAVKIDPKNSAYLDTIAWIYFKLADYKKAERYEKESIALRTPADGSPATLEEHMGDIYQKLGQKRKAIEHWKKALKADPTNKSVAEKIEKAKI
ncbi:MAG: tetratricopeptide repeat protein [Bacteroidetes bacterium]|nr:tetratricopeptide repeat protein [Bacteroidota bacterium]